MDIVVNFEIWILKGQEEGFYLEFVLCKSYLLVYYFDLLKLTLPDLQIPKRSQLY